MQPLIPPSDVLLRNAMTLDNWKTAYIDELLHHMQGLRAAGMTALLTQNLVQKYKEDGYLLTCVGGPRDGVQFGSLRGDGLAVSCWEQYVRTNFEDGGEIIDLVIAYAKGVKSSSWAPMVQIVKGFLVDQRTAPLPDTYFWKGASDAPQSWALAQTGINGFLNSTVEAVYTPPQIQRRAQRIRNAIITWHAFTQELLNCTAFPGNDQVAREITVVRTESAEAAAFFMLGGQRLTKEQVENIDTLIGVPLTGVRGALESSSVYTVKNIHGYLVAEYKVPFHRVFALYMTAQPKSSGLMLSLFENDTENEVTFMPEGLPFVLKKQDDLTFAAPAKTKITW